MKKILWCMLLLMIMLGLTSCILTDGDPVLHKHSVGLEVMENENPATCLTDGSYDVVAYCSTCFEEISRETKIIKSAGHKSAKAVKENEILPTCYDDGSYDSVEYCSECNEELSRKTVVDPTIGHQPGEETRENEVPAGCLTDGSYVSVVCCSVCNTELTRTDCVDYATGHKWDGLDCTACDETVPGSRGLEYTLSENGEHYIVTGIGTCEDTELVIPSQYNGIPVKEIGNYAFENCKTVTKATIPAGIIRIGYGAALGCSGLKSLEIEDKDNWELMDGFDATSGTALDSSYFSQFIIALFLSQITTSDQYWLMKNV